MKAQSNIQTIFLFMLCLLFSVAFTVSIESFCASDYNPSFNNTDNESAIQSTNNYINYLNPFKTNCESMPQWYKLIIFGIFAFVVWYFLPIRGGA